jgi:hypothetical protein
MKVYILNIENVEGDTAHFSAHSTRASAAEALREFARAYLGAEPEPPATLELIAWHMATINTQPSNPNQSPVAAIDLWHCEIDGHAECLLISRPNLRSGRHHHQIQEDQTYA